MKARRLEDVFEECLTAYLEKGRSVEESLSLYPALASQLEPLLRTAVSVSQTFEAAGPPWHAIERGRNKFLASASAYATGKALLRDSRPRHTAPWGKFQWSALGGAAAAMAAVVVVGAIMVSGGSGSSDGDDGGVVSQPSPTARPVPNFVNTFTVDIGHAVEQAQAGQPLSVDAVAVLQAQYEADIAAELADPTLDPIERAALVEQIRENQQELQALPVEQQTPGVIGLLSLVDLLLLDLTATPVPTEVPVATPVPTDAPVDTPVPTDVPVETPAPTPGPTDAPVETPVPTDAPAPTQDPGPQSTPEPTPVFRLFGF